MAFARRAELKQEGESRRRLDCHERTAVKRVLITGGAGFVGASVALRFREAWPEAEIVALDSLYRRGSELNARRLREARVSVVIGDVRDRRSFEMPPCDLVVDAAAEPSVLAGTRSDTRFVVDTNLGGTLHALEAAREWAAAFVFLSTSRVYPVAALRSIALEETATRFEIALRQELPGVTPDGISEDFPLSGSRTLYGATKYAAEIMVQEYAAHYGLRAVINRCGILAGPWQMARVDQGVVGLWVARHFYGLPLSYIGYGGKQVRDALHVEDLADLVLLQLKESVPLSGQVYNVGGGPPISFSLRELTELVRAAVGRTVDVGMQEQTRAGDVPLYLTDAARVRQAFGWRPTRTLERIVEDTARWVADHAEALRPVFCER